jgi:hypothetical protein
MSDIDELDARVRQLLIDLGDTPDAVADRLRALEIKGQCGQPRRCPIANYVRSRMPEEVGAVSAIPSRVRVLRGEAPISRWGGTVTTEAVYVFIRRFDRGVYLDLIEVSAP